MYRKSFPPSHRQTNPLAKNPSPRNFLALFKSQSPNYLRPSKTPATIHPGHFRLSLVHFFPHPYRSRSRFPQVKAWNRPGRYFQMHCANQISSLAHTYVLKSTQLVCYINDLELHPTLSVTHLISSAARDDTSTMTWVYIKTMGVGIIHRGINGWKVGHVVVTACT